MKTSKRRPKKISQPLMVVVVAVILVAVFLVAWSVNNDNTDTSKDTAATLKAADSSCLKSTNDTDLCKFASNLNPKLPYKAIDVDTDNTGTNSLTILADGKGNNAITTIQSDKETAAFISLNGGSYVKDEATGSWTKYIINTGKPAGDTSPTSSLKVNNNNITNNGALSYKRLGKEACGKLTCFKYQISDNSTPTTTQYVWFDDAAYQLQRFYTKNPNATNDMSFTYQTVNISAPSPVNDATNSSAANPYAN